MIDHHRLKKAYEKARSDLLAGRIPGGHWEGQLSSSALSTATAVSALACVLRNRQTPTDATRLRSLIERGLSYVAAIQNSDGGWGDTDRSLSNIATTMLVRAAIYLAGESDRFADALRSAETYLDRQGWTAGLKRRYGRDKTFAVPILTNCALAGLVPWSEVSPLPFELACFPPEFYRFLRLPVVSYAVPALVAIGQARYHHRKPLNPFTRMTRSLSVRRSLCVVQRMQPESGGFLEATPLTSFVVMSLAGIGRADHPIVRRGVQFLIDSAGEDGSWPIDTNLATWVTTLSINALDDGSLAPLGVECLPWLLRCQHRVRHPFTNADPGGWGWTDLSGAVPDADDTPGALLALARVARHVAEEHAEQIREAARAGVDWLLGLQNRNGGWPTFCRGWGKLPFDRSSTDLTAHALRALHAWRDVHPARIQKAIRRGFTFLDKQQRTDGSWVPLWFGNQYRADEENPVYGTARVLLAYRDLDRLGTKAVSKGLDFLVGEQRDDGGWGAAPSGEVSSVEETAVAVEALLASPAVESAQTVIQKGLEWLVQAVEQDRYRDSTPIGFYFARLWYYEKLYPLIFTLSALRRAADIYRPDA
ncbi:MAG: squalene--hopene cyclase [Planctomycetaceae bacterium]|nr:squalene--hopene cyclase [Planctomycetaceae bacterium]